MILPSALLLGVSLVVPAVDKVPVAQCGTGLPGHRAAGRCLVPRSQHRGRKEKLHGQRARDSRRDRQTMVELLGRRQNGLHERGDNGRRVQLHGTVDLPGNGARRASAAQRSAEADRARRPTGAARPRATEALKLFARGKLNSRSGSRSPSVSQRASPDLLNCILYRRVERPPCRPTLLDRHAGSHLICSRPAEWPARRRPNR